MKRTVYSDSEIGIIKEYYKIDINKCIELLPNRTIISIKKKAHSLGIKKKLKFINKGVVCSVDGCSRDCHTKGMCEAHYRRMVDGSKMIGEIRFLDKNRKCSIDGCGKKHDAAGYCQSHYKRFTRQKVWELIIELKGGCCNVCKNKFHFSCYDLHHINPKTKDFSIADKISNYSLDSILKEAEKCELLCSNCHRELHYRLY